MRRPIFAVLFLVALCFLSRAHQRREWKKAGVPLPSPGKEEVFDWALDRMIVGGDWVLAQVLVDSKPAEQQVTTRW